MTAESLATAGTTGPAVGGDTDTRLTGIKICVFCFKLKWSCGSVNAETKNKDKADGDDFQHRCPSTFLGG